MMHATPDEMLGLHLLGFAWIRQAEFSRDQAHGHINTVYKKTLALPVPGSASVRALVRSDAVQDARSSRRGSFMLADLTYRHTIPLVDGTVTPMPVRVRRGVYADLLHPLGVYCDLDGWDEDDGGEGVPARGRIPSIADFFLRFGEAIRKSPREMAVAFGEEPSDPSDAVPVIVTTYHVVKRKLASRAAVSLELLLARPAVVHAHQRAAMVGYECALRLELDARNTWLDTSTESEVSCRLRNLFRTMFLEKKRKCETALRELQQAFGSSS